MFNKIDAVSPEDLKKQVDNFSFRTDYLKYLPHIRVSALKDEKTGKIFKIIDKLIEERNKRVPEAKLNSVFTALSDVEGIYSGGKKLKIKFIKQIKTSPPGFIIFSNMDISRHPGLWGFSAYNIKRFIEHRIREKFGFEGTPLFFKYKF